MVGVFFARPGTGVHERTPRSRARLDGTPNRYRSRRRLTRPTEPLRCGLDSATPSTSRLRVGAPELESRRCRCAYGRVELHGLATGEFRDKPAWRREDTTRTRAHRLTDVTNGAETITRVGAASRVTQTLPLEYPGRLTDDRIVELVDALPNRTMALIYTSDAGLRARVRALGAGSRRQVAPEHERGGTRHNSANSRRLAHSPAADGPGRDHGLEGSVLSGSGLPIITAALCADAIGVVNRVCRLRNRIQCRLCYVRPNRSGGYLCPRFRSGGTAGR